MYEFSVASERPSVGESIIALLKLATLDNWPELDDDYHLEYVYGQTMKSLLFNPTIDICEEIRNNQGLAEYVLE